MEVRTKNFSLEKTLESGQVFNYFLDESGYYYVQHDNNVFKVRQLRSVLEFYTYPNENDIDLVRNYLQFDSHYIPALQKYSADKVVQKAISVSNGVRIIKQDPYECVISYILSQYSSIPRIKSNIAALSRKYGGPFEFDGKTFYSFPPASALAAASEKELRSLKLGYRAKYLRNTCAKLLNGFELTEIFGLDYKVAKERLMQLDGVGEKVADCILLYAFEQYQAFPVDTWIRKIMNKYYLQGESLADNKIARLGRNIFGKKAGLIEIFFYSSRKHLV